MNKIKKLLIFSCCLIVAALSALWVGCKNEISLEAEESVTTPTLTLAKDGSAITASLLPDNVEVKEYKWYELTTEGEVVQMKSEEDSGINISDDSISDIKKIFCVATISTGENILSNLIDSNGDTCPMISITENVVEYDGTAKSPAGNEYFNMPYRKANASSTDDSAELMSEITDIGIYEVTGDITFTCDNIKATRTADTIGYFAIVPPTYVDYSKKLNYGDTLSVDDIKNLNVVSGEWGFSNSSVEKITPEVNSGGYKILMQDEYNGDVLNSFENINNYYDTENSAWKSTLRVTVNPKELTSDDVNITLDEDSVICSGKKWKPTVTVFLDGNALTEDTDYSVEYPVNMVDVGEKEITVKFIGNYTGTATVTGEITENEWGTLVTDSGHQFWVDAEGKTSAEVEPNEIVWLKEESDNSSAWYGLDNSNNVFEANSRFWVKWLNEKENKEEWETYYSMLDDEHKEKAEDKKLWIFLCGVTDPAGNEYTTITPSADMYIQLGDDWTQEDIRATFISDAIDEPVESVEYLDNLENAPTTGEFAKLGLKHFSPYAVYDELTDEEKELMEKLLNGELTEDELNDMVSEADLQNNLGIEENEDDNIIDNEPSISYITGDQRGYVIIIAVVALIIAGITLAFSLKNKKNK
ncbi:MAG: hypothetical protein ACI4PR_01485 [Acutalibacteraceae bacterium]